MSGLGFRGVGAGKVLRELGCYLVGMHQHKPYHKPTQALELAKPNESSQPTKCVGWLELELEQEKVKC